jgi:hypothetical protein
MLPTRRGPRRRDVADEQLRTRLKRGVSQRDIARRLGTPRSPLREHLKRQQVVPVHRGTPTVIPRSGPRAELAQHRAIKAGICKRSPQSILPVTTAPYCQGSLPVRHALGIL